MDENDLKILQLANSAIIVIAVEELVHVEERPLYKRIFGGGRYNRFNLCPEYEQHPDVVSINRLVEEEWLNKSETKVVTQAVQHRNKHIVERHLKETVYRITESGRERLAEMLPDYEKATILNMQDFKNGNSPF